MSHNIGLNPAARNTKRLTLVRRILTPYCFLEDVWQTAPANTQALGFKIFTHQNSTALTALVNDPRVAKIILTREDNPVRQYLSHAIMRTTGISHTGKPYYPPSVTINPERMRAWINRNRKRFKRIRETLRATDQTWHELTYADVANRSDALIDVFSFLGLKAPDLTDPAGKPQKLNKGPLEELITNYREVASALTDTELAPYLDDATPNRK